MNQVNGILDRLNGLDVFTAEREVGFLFDSNRQVDGVDAVEIEIFLQAGVKANRSNTELELVGEDFDHPLQDFILGMHRRNSSNHGS